jgi:ABC-type transport system involved in multi-copper enzyme maturation permease subunit
MKMFIKIVKYTIADQMRAKSFYLLMAISLGLLFLMRGCFSTDYVINGQQVESLGYISRIIFQVIAMGMLLMISIISMGIFTRDKTDGSLQMFLSRPVNRREYVLGRIIGTWLLISGFMLILHSTLFFIVWFQSGEVNWGYIAASILCSVNLLFIAGTVFLFSLIMPDFIAALFSIGIVCIGFVSDGGYRLLNSQIVSNFVDSAGETSPALWRVLYPKLFMVQALSDSFISQNQFINLGPVNPLMNLLGFIVLILFITISIFNKKSF